MSEQENPPSLDTMVATIRNLRRMPDSLDKRAMIVVAGDVIAQKAEEGLITNDAKIMLLGLLRSPDDPVPPGP